MPYQVKDWSTHFENDRSKERDRCSFVCVPNKQHGMGFSYVMAEKDGAMVYGIWQLIIGACSQQKRPRNGWLTSDGDKAGSPWGVEDLAMKFRRPVSEIRRAVEVLCSAKVCWLVFVQVVENKDLPLTPDALPTNSLSTPLEWKGKEGKEEKGSLMSGKPDERGNSSIWTQCRIVLHYLNERVGRHFREVDANLKIIRQRLEEDGVTIDGIKQMIDRQADRWKGTSQEEYLRPETLFGKSKFDSYYAAKDLPIAPPSGKQPTRSIHEQEADRLAREVAKL